MSILNQMYHYKYTRKQDVEAVTRRALAIPEPADANMAAFNLKLLIAIDALVGLHHFEESLLRQIRFESFRPLSLAIVI